MQAIDDQGRLMRHIGILVALTLYLSWASLLGWAVMQPTLVSADLSWALPVALLLTWLSTGLFITAHDAMHGLVAPGQPRLNHAIGALCLRSYALFDFATMREAHHRHHRSPGNVAIDPDTHDGEHSSYPAWYWRFFTRYTSWRQLFGMMVIFDVLAFAVGLPVYNLLLFWVGPALLSTHQLFFFGTYLPHRGEHGDDPHQARSVALPVPLSLLTCFHFGYHREHHVSPSTPWWGLPELRRE